MRQLLLYYFLFACLILSPAESFGQTDSSHFIKVHFLYGSKPKKQFSNIEKKWFGGLHGGHVSIETGNEIIGFEPKGKLHIFSSRRNKHSFFRREDLRAWAGDTATKKYVSIKIPITASQYQSIRQAHTEYLYSSPYDYAFFGMRCAAATYEILSKAGVVKGRSNFRNVITHFYPKLLRKKMLKLATKRGYLITSQPGRETRKWERDRLFE